MCVRTCNCVWRKYATAIHATIVASLLLLVRHLLLEAMHLFLVASLLLACVVERWFNVNIFHTVSRSRTSFLRSFAYSPLPSFVRSFVRPTRIRIKGLLHLSLEARLSNWIFTFFRILESWKTASWNSFKHFFKFTLLIPRWARATRHSVQYKIS